MPRVQKPDEIPPVPEPELLDKDIQRQTRIAQRSRDPQRRKRLELLLKKSTSSTQVPKSNACNARNVPSRSGPNASQRSSKSPAQLPQTLSVPRLNTNKLPSAARKPGNCPTTPEQWNRNLMFEEMIKLDDERVKVEESMMKQQQIRRHKQIQDYLKKQIAEKERKRREESVADKPLRKMLEEDTALWETMYGAGKAVQELARTKYVEGLQSQLEERKKAKERQKTKEKEEAEREALSARMAAQYEQSEQHLYKLNRDERQREMMKQAKEAEERRQRQLEEERKRDKEYAQATDKILAYHDQNNRMREAYMKQKLDRTEKLSQFGSKWINEDARKKEEVIERAVSRYGTGEGKPPPQLEEMEKTLSMRKKEDLRKALEMQVKEKQLRKTIEQLEEEAYKARMRQDQMLANTHNAQKQALKYQKRYEKQQMLKEQMEERAKARARGVDAIGEGVTDREWRLNRRNYETLKASTSKLYNQSPSSRQSSSLRVAGYNMTGRGFSNRSESSTKRSTTSTAPFSVATDEFGRPIMDTYRRNQEEYSDRTAEYAMPFETFGRRRAQWYDQGSGIGV